jgi:hypothetical protein
MCRSISIVVKNLYAPTQQESTTRLPFHAGSQTLTLATERVPQPAYAQLTHCGLTLVKTGA